MPVNKDAIARTEERFALARQHQIPPYNWIPPKKLPLRETPNQRKFRKNLDMCKAIEIKKLENAPGTDTPDIIQGVTTFEKLPNPFSDFEHIVESEDKEAFLALQKDPEGKATNDAALARLKSAFDFLVCRTLALCNAINHAVKYDPSEYDGARRDYIEFLQNLDDHEPNANLTTDDLKRGLGYGKNYRWLLVDPVITKVPIKKSKNSAGSVKALITGATIILHWNPHSSSSGIPIPDPPR